jgi:hypothetical protein
MSSSSTLESIIRWTARSWALASLLFLSAFIFGGAERSGNWPTITQWIGLAFFPTGVIAGLLIAFWKELLGGGIAALSLTGFYAWHFAVSGRPGAGPWFVAIAAPGFLFLIAGLLARSRPVRSTKDSAGWPEPSGATAEQFR